MARELTVIEDVEKPAVPAGGIVDEGKDVNREEFHYIASSVAGTRKGMGTYIE